MRAHVPRHVELTLAEPGCLAFEVTPTLNPLAWEVHEAFTDEDAFRSHQARVAESVWGHATREITRRLEAKSAWGHATRGIARDYSPTP